MLPEEDVCVDCRAKLRASLTLLVSSVCSLHPEVLHGSRSAFLWELKLKKELTGRLPRHGMWQISVQDLWKFFLPPHVWSCGSGSEERLRYLEFPQRLGPSNWEDCGSGNGLRDEHATSGYLNAHTLFAPLLIRTKEFRMRRFEKLKKSFPFLAHFHVYRVSLMGPLRDFILWKYHMDISNSSQDHVVHPDV